MESEFQAISVPRGAYLVPPGTARVEVLERQVLELRRQVQRLREWQDVVSSPLWKRLWFVLCGWNFGSLGRWYRKSLWKG